MNKLRRIVAWLTVFLIAGLLVAMLVSGIMGSPYFYVFLFLTLVVPMILWVFMWFTRLVNGESEVIPKEDMERLNQSHSEQEQTEDNDNSEKEESAVKPTKKEQP